MKKRLIFLLIGTIICMFSACGQRKDIEYNQADISNNVENELMSSDNVTDNEIVNELEKLSGEYEYLSDYGVGKLIIEENEYGYDISDYESQSSYRFLADSSNIESIENNRIYIKN